MNIYVRGTFHHSDRITYSVNDFKNAPGLLIWQLHANYQARYIGPSREDPYTGTSLSAPYANASREAPYAGTSLSAHFTNASLEAPCTGGSLSAPHIGASLEAPYTGGSLSVLDSRPCINEHLLQFKWKHRLMMPLKLD